MQRIGVWLLQNRINAAVVAFTLSLLQYFRLPVGWLASILIAMVTLRKGYKDGLYVALWSILPAVSLLFLGDRLTYSDALFMQVMLIYLLALILRETVSWSLTLEVGVIITSLSMLMMVIFIPEVKTSLALVIATVIQKIVVAKKMTLTPEQIEHFVKDGVYVTAGILAGLFLLSNVLNLLIARWWQSRLFNPGGFAKEFLDIRVSKVSAIILSVCIILGLLGINSVELFVPVFVIPFGLSGMGLVHSVLMQQPNKSLLLVIFYACLLVFALSMIFILALLGYVNSWYNLRTKMRAV